MNIDNIIILIMNIFFLPYSVVDFNLKFFKNGVCLVFRNLTLTLEPILRYCFDIEEYFSYFERSLQRRVNGA